MDWISLPLKTVSGVVFKILDIKQKKKKKSLQEKQMNVGKEVESVSQLSQFTIKNFQQHDRNGHQKGTWPSLCKGGGQSSGRENTRAPRVHRPGWRKSCSERLRHAEGPAWYTTQLNTDKNVSEEADRCLQEPPERAEDVNSQDPRGARDGPRSHRPEWRTRENALAEAAQAAPERWSLALTVTRLSWGSIKKI